MGWQSKCCDGTAGHGTGCPLCNGLVTATKHGLNCSWCGSAVARELKGLGEWIGVG